jgi:hypothetical protein
MKLTEEDVTMVVKCAIDTAATLPETQVPGAICVFIITLNPDGTGKIGGRMCHTPAGSQLSPDKVTALLFQAISGATESKERGH